MYFESCILKTPLKYVPPGPIDNKSLLVREMAWRQEVASHYLNNVNEVRWYRKAC